MQSLAVRLERLERSTLETPGPHKKGPDKKEVQAAKRLRQAGLKRRKG